MLFKKEKVLPLSVQHLVLNGIENLVGEFAGGKFASTDSQTRYSQTRKQEHNQRVKKLIKWTPNHYIPLNLIKF